MKKIVRIPETEKGIAAPVRFRRILPSRRPTVEELGGPNHGVGLIRYEGSAEPLPPCREKKAGK